MPKFNIKNLVKVHNITIFKMKHYIKRGLLLFINFLFWRGIFDNTINKFSNECEMTYMYEYPEYIEVNLENQNFDYKLYVYGEGKYAAHLKKKVYKGIPVLFIPGNQGSSKQVRSLASVAYRMAQKYSTAYHFNYFAVDFNEEIGALFGPLLDRQTEFVELSIKKILSLYQNEPNNPKSVILVGHSVGGLVARAVVDEFWAREKDLKLNNIVLVSIGGGKNDNLIPSILTSSKFADVDETLLSVPLCWLTTDHLAIVWCKQLVLAINRALFNSVDTSTLQLSSDRNHIIQSFKDDLSQKLNSEIPSKTIEQKIKSHLEKKSDFVELTKLQSLKTFKNTFRSKMFLIPLTFTEKNRILSIIMKDVSPNSFVFSSKIDNGSDIIHLDYETVVQHRLRSIPKRRQEVNIDLKSIQIVNHTHVIAYAEPSNKQATFALDINDKYSHYARIEAPNFVSSFSPIVIMNQTPPNALSINITIENFIEYWQSYTLNLLPIGSCTANDGLPFVSLRSSWLDRWEYVIRRRNDSNEFVLGLDVPSPNPEHGQVQLHIVLDPSCTYSISFQKSLRGIFDRISLLSAPQMPAFVVSQLLLILASQLKAVNDGSISSLNSQIAQLTPFSVVPLTKICGMLLEKYTSIETDKSYLEKHRTNFAILPMLLFVSSIPLTYAASVFLKSLLYILSLCTRRFFYRELNYSSKDTFP
ncbi:GPI inositol-deacylase [Armadillidium nasatum]|uniref:GPI inositol-deacylase n=1 Tax=Armadillidium nasatum TaxID=96803 RepID=A0A5N5SHG4_9CRUS|nr:GPI inositol-deacylase [Armadillidium nasatum]